MAGDQNDEEVSGDSNEEDDIADDRPIETDKTDPLATEEPEVKHMIFAKTFAEKVLYITEPVKKQTRSCHGVKMCEYVSDNIRQMSHSSVDPNSPIFARILEVTDLLPHSADTAKYETKA
ncbi:hypothetical protein DFS34DRAFT_590926 [Phlyctochytrium arcticum]|nr:hypothetical protein DFS34DRAFT_590926 [Phlyctochytrium arcticum]